MNAAHPSAFSPSPGLELPAERLPLRRTELVLIFGFWTLIGLLSLANVLFEPPRARGLMPLPPLPVSTHAILAFAESYLWAALTPLIFRMAGRLSIERANWLPHALMLFAIGIVFAILVDLCTGLLRTHLFHAAWRQLTPDAEQPVLRVMRLWFVNEFIVYIAILATGFARHYFLRYRARREEAIHLQTHAAQLQAQLADARLAALRSQLDPHFLFNTLHAISALVERDPRGVRRMIACLSELLRSTLDGAREQEASLEQELAFLERYLEIMRIRFQGRLEVAVHVTPDVRDALVPNLILQPLVENAIKHGVSKIDGPGHIEIEAHREEERLVLTVRDNGPAFTDKDVLTAEGLGLRNTRARLEQLYGTAQRLSLRALNGGGAIAEVVVPYHTRSDLRAAVVAPGA